MRPLRRFAKRLGCWLTRHSGDARLRLEIEEHLALQTLENTQAGMSPAEARRQAVLKFGAVESMRESYRDQKGLPFMEILLQDIRQALMRLRKTPAFAVTTILTLALGIGATTSIFTLVHAVLMKSLAVANPDELYRLGKVTHCCEWGGYGQEKEFSIVSYDLYQHFRENTKGFAELAAFQAGTPLLGIRRAGGTEVAQSYPGELVSGNYFAMFGIRPYAGRLLNSNDDEAGAPPAVVMSYRLWQQKYAASPALIGSVFNLNDKPFTLVGITPPGFFGDTLRPNPPDFFLPIATEPMVQGDSSVLHRPSEHWLDLIGRIQPGANAAAIQAQMRMELMQWLRSHWGEMNANERANFPDQTLYLSPGGAGITSMRERYQHWLQMLMMISGFVLLIVCANVANLMLVRGMERRQQTSLSMALGARPSRLVRQALTESILLSLLGGAAGLALAFAGTRLILHFTFQSLPGLASVPISSSPSVPVLLFTFAVSLLTGVVFGIAPAWMAASVDPIEALRGANRSTGRSGSLPRKMLVIVQTALSLVLLSAAGLLTVALGNLEKQDFGFEQDRRIIVSVDPQLAGYRADQLEVLYRRLHDAVAQVPGVAAVVLCAYSPQSGSYWNEGVVIDGHPAPGPRDENGSGLERVAAGYLEVIGTPILRGRGVEQQDTDKARHVAVINEAFARKFFRNEDPIGKHFGPDLTTARLYEIVGVAKDARYTTFDYDRPVGPFFFLPNLQYDVFPTVEATGLGIGSHFLHDIVIVTKMGAKLSSGEIRKAIASVDPNMPINFIRTLQEQVAGQFSQQRLMARLTSFIWSAVAGAGLHRAVRRHCV